MEHNSLLIIQINNFLYIIKIAMIELYFFILQTHVKKQQSDYIMS